MRFAWFSRPEGGKVRGGRVQGSDAIGEGSHLAGTRCRDRTGLDRKRVAVLPFTNISPDQEEGQATSCFPDYRQLEILLFRRGFK